MIEIIIRIRREWKRAIQKFAIAVPAARAYKYAMATIFTIKFAIFCRSEKVWIFADMLLKDLIHQLNVFYTLNNFHPHSNFDNKISQTAA